ncbi:MAG: hypothetical protein ACK5JN_02960 [Kluyvera sp.]|uniref:hypothetical protein n=1 Tax=Kluyvera sp. TaxID=1538228 RepID=UPI003A88E1CE
MTLNDLRQLITEGEVKAALDQQIYDSLTFNREGNTRVNVPYAIAAAARWGYARLLGAKAQHKGFDEDELEVIREALIKRAVYELGRTSEYKENFDMDRDDADTLFDAVLGRGDGSSDSGDNGTSADAMVGASGVQYEQVHKPCNSTIFPAARYRGR